MVPTSSSLTPACRMMSGIRNEPPISISSPRDTSTSRRAASALSISSTAAALLLTTVAASAPVSSHSSRSMSASRSPRRPEARSNSRLTGTAMACATARTASSGSSARPRLVCSTVPVRLNTGCRRGRAASPQGRGERRQQRVLVQGSRGQGSCARLLAQPRQLRAQGGGDLRAPMAARAAARAPAS